MIQFAHAATGALVGRNRSGARDALLAGLAMHAAMDVIPHGEVHDDRFELVTGAASLLLIAARHGWRAPVTMGALGSLIPDIEHVPKLFGLEAPPRFPTHRWGTLHGWEHKPFAMPAWLQAVLGGAVIGAIVATLRRRVDQDA